MISFPSTLFLIIRCRWPRHGNVISTSTAFVAKACWQSWHIKTSCIICIIDITVTIIVQLCPWSYNLKARAKVIYIYPPHTTPKYQICTGSIFTAAQIYPKNKFTRKQVWGDTWSRGGAHIYIYPLQGTPKDHIYIFSATQTKARVRRYLEPGRGPDLYLPTSQDPKRPNLHIYSNPNESKCEEIPGAGAAPSD